MDSGAETIRRQRAGAHARALAFERALVRIRWFGILLGLFQVLAYQPAPETFVPRGWQTTAYASLLIFTITNVVTILVLRRRPDEAALARLGHAVFAADMAGLWTMITAFDFEEFGATWVILVIACLEGALRYQMRGALVPVALGIPIETAREIYRVSRYDFDFYVSSITFRVGFAFIIAYVAGTMARNLQRERAEAERRAIELERVAAREAEARRESNAFQQVILAGVSAQGMHEALESMLEHIASDLGYAHIAVLMSDERGRLFPVAMRGFPPSVRQASVAPGEGIAGTVAVTGRTEIVPDVSKDPRYVSVEPSTRSQISLPIRFGDQIIGVLEVESSELNGFTERDQSRLERLGAQMALVIENARLLAQERATVERLRDLDTMKSDFIAIASHELRTPLTAIQGTIKTVQRPDYPFDSQQIPQFLNVLDRQAERLTRLVEDLLVVSRIDAGHVSLRMETVDMPGMIEEILEELGANARRVAVAIAPSLPRVVSDGQRIGQITRNLVENALKFSNEDSTVRLAVYLDAQWLVVEVADDGPGIPENEIPHIFDRFHQVGGSLRRRADGFGLGLYITKRLVEALGGTIEVDSTVGRGTTFRVCVPAARAAEASSDIA